MKIIKGGITAPKGYKAAGIHAGIKRRKKDLAIILSEVPAKAAAVFTKNVVIAAPLVWCKGVLAKNSEVRAIVVNSGNANACTGNIGYTHAEIMAETAARILGVQKDEILVSSTGVIGVPLPMDKIIEGIKLTSRELSNTEEASTNAAHAIMTTDTFLKEIALELDIAGKKVKMGGIAKGSGMIHPNMATMLVFITSDINISRELLDKALKETINDTFNMISVDGDTSTNDMVVALSNGLAGNPVIDKEDEEYFKFKEALLYTNKHLAKQIVMDGEGATKFLEVEIKDVKTKDNAQKLAKSIITSNLVKTAFFGEDANWGRVIAAMGYSGIDFDPNKVNMSFSNGSGSIALMKNGSPVEFDEVQATEILKNREIKITVSVNEGSEEAVAWGCDLSYEYVRINGEYRT